MAPLRVRFIVTGDMEHAAFVESFRRALPHDVDSTPVDYLPAMKAPSITSNPLPVCTPGRPVPTYIATLVKKLVSEATIGSDVASRPLDLVVAIDDLELANLGQAGLVADWIRRAVGDDLVRRAAGNQREHARLAKIVGERCSFHLLVPMAEAYFYPDADALRAAGVGSHHPLVPECDAEHFRTDDPGFLAATAALQASKPRYFRFDRHPKEYLAHLVERSGGVYAETEQGAAALKELSWSTAAGDPSVLVFARALFEDVADALGVFNPLGPGSFATETWTPRRPRRSRSFVLRNM